jgi:hypothetical protein
MAWHLGHFSPGNLLQKRTEERWGLRLHAVEPPPAVAGGWRGGRIQAWHHGRDGGGGRGVGVNDARPPPTPSYPLAPGLGWIGPVTPVLSLAGPMGLIPS